MAQKNAQNPLLSAYLVVGEDELKREAVLTRLHQRFDAMGDMAFNSDTIDGAASDGASIVTACQTAPFLAPLRLVVVKDADRLSKADAELIVNYLAAPADTAVLVLVADKLAKNTRLYKAVARIDKKAVISCEQPKPSELPRLVRGMAQKQGVRFTSAAVRRLIDLIGDDTVHLNAEVEKIALAHRGGDEVSESEVINLVAPVAEVKPWDFLDAFSARDLKRTLGLWRRMESTSPHAMVAMCAIRLRELICARTLDERGEGRTLAAVLKRQPWQVKSYPGWARGFSAEELRGALLTLRDADWAMKSGSNPDAVFTDWVIETLKRP